MDAERITLSAGQQLTVQASAITAQQDVLLGAQSLNISSAQGSYQQQQQHKRTDSGLLSTGGIGFMVGSRTQNDGGSDAGHLEYGSTLGSTQGSVILSATDDLNLRSSDLISGKDIRLSGKNISISSGENIQTALRTQEFHQAGITVSLSGSAGSALNTAVQLAQQAEQEPDGRLKALQALKAALSGVQAAQSVRMAQSNPADGNLIGVSVSLGAQTASAEHYSESHSATPATLSAARDISITATGDTATGSKTTGNGNITIQGSTLKAVRDTQLTATNDISLLSAANSQRLSGSNSSHGGSIGVSLGFGQNGFGLSIDASANSAHGAENGSGTSQQITTSDSGRNLTINAGGDTTLQGAQANAQHISLASGNNLTLSSEQHTDRFHSSQYSSSAGVSIPVYGYKTGSASISASRDKISSHYNSVTQQSGLFAGAGGFDIHTGNHTQLNGAVIASSAEKSKNILDTATLGFSNIQNAAAYDVQHQGISLSTGNPMSAAMSAAGSLAGANHSDSAASTTYAAVSDGNIIIRDKAHQKQSVSELSRDTDHAANGLSPIFNKQNELKRLQTVQLLGDIGSQVSDIALTEGKIRAAQQAKTQTENASATERRRVRNKLTAEANARAAKTGKPAAAVSEAAVTQKIYTTHYNQALTDSGFATGGKYQQAITAATAAIQGLITNSPGAALSGAAAPYLATEIKRLTTDKNDHQNKPAALLAHTIVNAALAAASGEGKQGAIAAAAGAVTGEATAIIASQAFHKPVSELSEEEKQTVSTLATLASGLAGGLLTDSGAGAVTAAQAGKTTVENNLLSNKYGVEKLDEKGLAFHKKLEEAGIGSMDELQDKFIACNGNAECERKTRNEYRIKEQEAGEKLVALYQSGNLTKDEYYYLTSDYTNTMLAGIEKGQKANRTGFNLNGDIYLLSGIDWTPAGQIYNPYLNAIRNSIHIADLKTQGVSDEKINESIYIWGILGSEQTPFDVSHVMNLQDNGLNKGDLPWLASSIISNKVIYGRQYGSLVSSSIQQKSARPTPPQSEEHFGTILGEGAQPQVSFKNRNKVSYGQPGSVRPDWCKGVICYEVKNYDIARNSRALINNVSKQVIKRKEHLPEDIQQQIIIDIRGQEVTHTQESIIINGIINKTNGIINKNDVHFMR